MRSRPTAGRPVLGRVRPDVVDLAGEGQGPVGLVPHRDDAIGSPAAGTPEPAPRAAPAGALLRPGGTPDRPLPVSRVAVASGPAGLPAVAENSGHQGRLGQLDLDGAI